MPHNCALCPHGHCLKASSEKAMENAKALLEAIPGIENDIKQMIEEAVEKQRGDNIKKGIDTACQAVAVATMNPAVSIGSTAFFAMLSDKWQEKIKERFQQQTQQIEDLLNTFKDSIDNMTWTTSQQLVIAILNDKKLIQDITEGKLDEHWMKKAGKAVVGFGTAAKQLAKVMPMNQVVLVKRYLSVFQKTQIVGKAVETSEKTVKFAAMGVRLKFVKISSQILKWQVPSAASKVLTNAGNVLGPLGLILDTSSLIHSLCSETPCKNELEQYFKTLKALDVRFKTITDTFNWWVPIISK